MIRIRPGSALGAGAAVLVALLGLPDRPAAAGAIAPDDPAQVALGAELYGGQCASCRGADLQGQADWQSRCPDGTFPAPPHDQTGHTWHYPDALVFDDIKRGAAAVVGGNFKCNMPGFGNCLTDDEIRAEIAFIRSTWSPAIRQRQPQRSAGG